MPTCFGLPLFFYVCGATASFEKVPSIREFAYRVTTQLLLPLVMGVVLFLWPGNYLDQSFEGKVNDEVISNPFSYLAYMLADLPAQLNWLWPLVALLVVVVACHPMVLWT